MMRDWKCPTCGMVRQALVVPNHRHEGSWVKFVEVQEEEPQPKRRSPSKS